MLVKRSKGCSQLTIYDATAYLSPFTNSAQQIPSHTNHKWLIENRKWQMVKSKICTSPLTKNTPQRENIIVARGSRLERSRFQSSPSIMKKKQVFDPGPSHGKRPCRILARSGTVSLQQTPRACVADAVNAPSIVQCRLVVSPMLWVGEGIGLSTI